MMNTKEAARRWDISSHTVAAYCASGIIPQAEKTGPGNSWQIPEFCDKPPMTRHGLCFLMDTVYQLNHGVDFKNITWGYTEEMVKEGFTYLIKNAFISSFRVERMSSELKNCTVTPRGEKLIARENEDSKIPVKFKAHVGIKGNLGVISAEADLDTTL